MRNITAYFTPATPHEALAIFRQQSGRGAFIAGGTQIAARRDPSLNFLVDLTACGLQRITTDAEYLRLGACVTLAEIQTATLLHTFASGMLAEVAGWTGSVQLRNAATIGGALMAQADLALAFLALDARVIIAGVQPRTVPLAEFYTATGLTLAADEIITALEIPLVWQDAAARAVHLSRTRQDRSLLTVAVALQDAPAHCHDARVVVAPVAVGMTRVPAVEAVLNGQALTPDVIAQAAIQAEAKVSLVADFRASADYRREVLPVYLKRALTAIEH